MGKASKGVETMVGDGGEPATAAVPVESTEQGGEVKAEEAKPLHVRMADAAASMASSQIAISFLLIVKPPSSVDARIMVAYYYFAMVDLATGYCLLFLHLAQNPSTDIVCLQATAVVAGFVAGVLDGFLYMFVSVSLTVFLVVVFVLAVSLVVLYAVGKFVRYMVVANKIHTT